MRPAAASLRSILGLVLLASAAGGVQAAVVDIPASKDNTLYDNNSPLSNGAGDYFFAGITQSRKIRRGVIAFDLAASIPAGSTVNSVTLTLYMSRTTAEDETIDLHRLVADWGEGTSQATGEEGGGASPTPGDATWDHTFYDTDFWAVPGGDFIAGASASQVVGLALGYYAWTSAGMVSDVQAWVDDPSSNFGWILIGRETDRRSAKRFDSRTNPALAQRPVLTVDYTPAGDPSGACCTGATCEFVTMNDCTTMGGVYQGDGVACTPNPCAEPFGACCASDGTCSEDTASNCDGAGGLFQGDGTTCATAECPIELTPYLDALPVPGPATPVSGQSGGAATYDITMREFQQQQHSELPPTTVWGYDDGFAGPFTPGPLIVARSGQPVTVNWFNDIRELGSGNLRTSHYLEQSADDLSCTHGAEDEAKTVTHLHGGHVPAAVDGYPEFTKLPGAPPDVYLYPNDQQAAPIWFHDHALGITRLNVYMGLAGLYYIRDDVEDALDLPQGEYEIPLVLQDRRFNPDGSYFYPGTWQEHFFGDKVMVNGKVWPYLDVAQGKYRFRLLNGSGSRVYTLSLNAPGGGMTFTVIGNEGGLLEAPAAGVTSLTIGPGERYDVVLDFEPYATNDEILLENSAPAPFPNGTVDLTQVMQFRVGSAAGDTDPLPGSLRPIERLQEADAIMTRDFELRRSGLDACGRAHWEINGLRWDDVTEYPELGTTEIWRFINDSGISHPMHMHLVFFQILDRDGFTRDGMGNIVPDGNPQPPAPGESGWKDTAMVGPNEIMRVIVRFEDYKGLYAYHCHILEHEDHEMMRQFRTQLCGDAEVDPTEECDDLNPAGLDGCGGCEIEEFVKLAGTAAGDGPVSITVEGELVTVNPTAGQTAAQVAAALAAAINANGNLQALGVTAQAAGDRVVTNGDVTGVSAGDTGLSDLLELNVEATRLWWGEVGAAGYDVLQGDVFELSATGGDFSDPLVTETCLGSGQLETFVEGPVDPQPGNGYWYLVRDTAGSYDTGAPSQAGPRDAAIAGSGNDCP
jgi:spore coat protein A